MNRLCWVCYEQIVLGALWRDCIGCVMKRLYWVCYEETVLGVLWRDCIRIWISSFYTGIFQEEVRETNLCSQYRKSWSRNFKSRSPKYKSALLSLSEDVLKIAVKRTVIFHIKSVFNLISVFQESALWSQKVEKYRGTLCWISLACIPSRVARLCTIHVP